MLTKGRYRARQVAGPEDLRAAQRLRFASFREGRGGADAAGPLAGLDADRYDPLCRHFLVEDLASGRLVCTYRLLLLAPREVGRSYSAQFYNLSRLAQRTGRMAEMGRFCVAAACPDPDIPRIAWGAVTRVVDAEGIGFLFGCSSFAGTEPCAYSAAFARLRQCHLAPLSWRPGVGSAAVYRFSEAASGPSDPRRAHATMPPLLRSYLAMGGLVSDHAVIDRELQTMHVFTGLDIAAVPPARARALRAIAG